MQTSAQLRLSLTTLVVLLLGMGLAAALSWLAVERLYLDTQRENLLAQAELTAAALQGSPLPATPIQTYSQLSNIQPGIHTRLLGEQGGVIVNLPDVGGDGPAQVPLAENAASVSTADLLGRPEIQSARGGIPSTAVRRVVSAENRRVLYAAAPLYSDAGNIAGIVYLATPLPPASLPTDIVLQLLGAVLAAILLAWLAGILLSRRISSPLEKLVSAADAVAGGDLDQRVPVGSDISELYRLGKAFNHMTGSLRQSEIAKNAFVADVTHELRTPLTVINGTIETLEDGAIDDLEGRGPLLQSMGAETQRLIRLVNDLLVLTRADAGALNLNLESVDLVNLARARCKGFSGLAGSRRVELVVEAREQARVRADADRLTQILNNLLDNAIRHAPDGSAVRVEIRQDENEIYCTVSDQGAGIPAEHLPFIFERFYRVEPSRGRRDGGSGLGLAIVQSLLAAQGGRIRVDSEVSAGTKFTFWLPAAEN
jgi:signal transduction histidine kinase